MYVFSFLPDIFCMAIKISGYAFEAEAAQIAAPRAHACEADDTAIGIPVISANSCMINGDLLLIPPTALIESISMPFA